MSTVEYPVFFAPIELTAAAQTLYTVPGGAKVLRNLYVKVTNYTGTARTVDVWNVPSGDARADDTAAVKGYAVPANDFVLIPVTRLAAGGTVEALADAITALVATPHGGDLYTP